MSAVIPGLTEDLPVGWRWERIDTLCEIRLGKMLSPAAKVGTSPLPYLRNQNVQWSRFELSDIARMDFTDEEQQKFMLRKGDLLVCEGGEPGRAAVWGGEIEPCFYQKALHRLRPKNSLVDPHFLMHRLRLSAISGEFFDSHSKTTIAHLPLVRLATLRVAVPSLQEQERIAAMLNEQMASASALHSLAEGLHETTSSLNDSFLESFFSSSRAGSWPLRRIDEVATGERAISDGPFGSHLKTEHYAGEGARVVRLQNIGRGEFLNSDKAYVSLDHFSNLTRHAVQVNDIVVAALGDGARPAGRACLIPADFGLGLVKADCFRIRVDPSVALPEFVMAFLNSPKRLRSVNAAMRGATRPRVTLAMLRDTRVPVPPLPEQVEAVSKLSTAFAQARWLTEMALETSRAISDLPAKLLAQAFSGAL